MMTLSMSDLARAMAMTTTNGLAPAARRQTNIRRAFISESAFSIGDRAYPAVVTADYIDKDSGSFDVNFDLLGLTVGNDPVSLTIDDNDIRAIRKMLAIGHEIEQSLTPRGQDDLAKAIHALDEIAAMDVAGEWSDIAMRCIDIAQATLQEIASEADNGTPSDS